MGQAKAVSIRQKIALAHKQGCSYSSLAREYSMSYNTIRSICIRYESSGELGLIPHYGNCGRLISKDSERSFRLVRLIKHLHPDWGISYILVRLGLEYPDLSFQSERHYQRRIAFKRTKVPPSQIPAVNSDRARLAHDTWQIDAKERIGLSDGKEYCFLNVTDEKTAALLKTKTFPPGAD